jgi:hypothetical protein
MNMSKTYQILAGTGWPQSPPVAAHAQQAGGGTATYWMSAETQSGLSTMGQAAVTRTT